VTQVLVFVAGLLLANGVPHFVNGISGRRFHSPFARPPVRGKSSALSNVLWGLANFLVAFLLLGSVNGFVFGFNLDCALFAGGFMASSLGLAVLFGGLADE
jgi:hypothetical protein